MRREWPPVSPRRERSAPDSMKIFFASDTTPNGAIASNLWRSNLYEPLVDLGHDVVEFRYDLRETFRNVDPADPGQRAFIARNRPRLSRDLLQQIRAVHAARPVDLFFSYFYDACVLPEAVEEIKRMGIVTVNWYCNGSYQLHLVSEIAPHYDWCLVPEKFRLKDYERLGARPIYCQEAANPNVYKPADIPVEFDVTFVGQGYGDRPSLIRYLLDQGIDIRVWGTRWEWYVHKRPAQRIIDAACKLTTPEGRAWAMQRLRRLVDRGDAAAAPPAQPVRVPQEVVGGVLTDAEMIQMYSRSRINLGFSSVGDIGATPERILQVRLRDFEVPMSGGFYMVEYMEELEEFFQPGKEIVCYRTKEDLAEKIRYYLTHEAERERIRRAGHERARADHTWHRRFQMAFQKMGLA